MSRLRVRWAAHSSTHVVRPRVTGVAPSTRNMTPTLKRFRPNVAARGFCHRAVPVASPTDNPSSNLRAITSAESGIVGLNHLRETSVRTPHPAEFPYVILKTYHVERS